MKSLSPAASTALVGSYDRVAAAIRAYIDAGFSTFILHGYPMVDEAE